MAENPANPLNTRDLLARFVAPEGEAREYLRKPHRHDGFLYASDGSIVVRVPDDPDIEVALTWPSLRFAKLLDKEWGTPGYSPAPMPPLPALPCCPYCDGTGLSFECPDCHGDGDIACSLGHLHECARCEGNGRVYTSQGRAEPCPECKGRKIDCDRSGKTLIAIGEAHFRLHYLHCLAALPGLELFVHDDHSPYVPMRFRFARGLGLLMPSVLR